MIGTGRKVPKVEVTLKFAKGEELLDIGEMNELLKFIGLWGLNVVSFKQRKETQEERENGC